MLFSVLGSGLHVCFPCACARSALCYPQFFFATSSHTSSYCSFTGIVVKVRLGLHLIFLCSFFKRAYLDSHTETTSCGHICILHFGFPFGQSDSSAASMSDIYCQKLFFFFLSTFVYSLQDEIAVQLESFFPLL